MEASLAIPSYYRSEMVGTLYQPETGMAANAGQKSGMAPAEKDARQRALLLIDPQVDFIHEDGALSVPGAVEDTQRTIDWIYRHTPEISAIAASLDSHFPMQIFYPGWWISADGKHPEPYTIINAEAAQADLWQPTHEHEWSLEYLEKLEQQAKKELMIWPYHTMVGTPGHAIVPPLYEALIYHSSARDRAPKFVHKGMQPQSEFYSMLEPEVEIDDGQNGGFNRGFVEWLDEFDEIYIAGQAKSHCVLETLGSLVRRRDEYPGLLDRIYLLEDCTSSVAHPEIDFEAMAQAQLAEFDLAGLNRILSTHPICNGN